MDGSILKIDSVIRNTTDFEGNEAFGESAGGVKYELLHLILLATWNITVCRQSEATDVQYVMHNHDKISLSWEIFIILYWRNSVVGFSFFFFFFPPKFFKYMDLLSDYDCMQQKMVVSIIPNYTWNIFISLFCLLICFCMMVKFVLFFKSVANMVTVVRLIKDKKVLRTISL